MTPQSSNPPICSLWVIKLIWEEMFPAQNYTAFICVCSLMFFRSALVCAKGWKEGSWILSPQEFSEDSMAGLRVEHPLYSRCFVYLIH